MLYNFIHIDDIIKNKMYLNYDEVYFVQNNQRWGSRGAKYIYIILIHKQQYNI